jgi:hypothetical protein
MKQPEKETSPIQNYFRFARNIVGGDLLENFLVSAVASLLIIRLFLSITDYPQLGGSGLHFAHMLWGGILMLIALFISLGFLSRPAHQWAAVLGGIGFGAFIDELGKFITQDYNYFFQPAIAIIYVTFILIYLAIRVVFNYRPMTPQENLANVLELLKQASLNGLDARDEQMLDDLLQKCDPANSLTIKLKDIQPFFRVERSRKPHLINNWKYLLDRFYRRIVTRWWYAGVVVAFFAVTAISGFSAASAFIAWPWTLILGTIAASIILLAMLQFWRIRIPNLQVPLSGSVIGICILAGWLIIINRGHISLPFADWALFICSSVSAVLIISGIVFMPRSRLRAYQMYQRGVLVSTLLTQVFAFYEYQFYALIGLFLNILILLALRFMIHREFHARGPLV